MSKEYELLVRLGEWDTQTTKEFLPHEDYKVVSIAIHPSFKEGSLWNDIALLKLDHKVEFKPHIDSICLPNTDENFDAIECVTTGWGKNAYSMAFLPFLPFNHIFVCKNFCIITGGGSYSNILKEVRVTIKSHYDCQKALQTTRLGPRFR